MGMIMLNGIAYTSTDGARDFPPLIYSTEEQEVGVWTDGKPLYQKSILDNTERDGSVSTEQYVDINADNIEEVVNVQGIVSFGTNGTWLPLPFSDNAGNTLSNSRVKVIGTNINSTRARIRFEIGNNYNGTNKVNKVRITILYTKSTDTPGSGKWSAFGGGSNLIHEEYFEWQRGTSSTTAESMRYTAPCDGWVTVLQYMDKNNDVYCCVEAAIYNPNTNITKQVDIDDGRQRYHTWHLGFPAKRGDVIIIKTRLDSGTLPTSATFRFMG